MGVMLGISRNMCLADVQKTMKDVAAPSDVVNSAWFVGKTPAFWSGMWCIHDR